MRVYCYVYDAFVQERKYERELLAIEHRITDLGLQGKIVRLALFRDPTDQIRREIEAGAKTVVVVGNDQTVHQVLNTVVDYGATLGLIPVGAPNVLAKILGVTKGVQACDVLSQRILAKLDVGRMNGQRFLTGVRFDQAITRVQYADDYQITSNRTGQLEIHNLCIESPKDETELADPLDAKQRVLLTTQKRKGLRTIPSTTQLDLQQFVVAFDEQVTAVADGVETEGKEFDITTEPGVLSVVVSRDRMFS